MTAPIPVNEPLLDGNEKRYLAECIDTGWISSEGPFVAALERGMAARLGRAHGVAVCNGTAALDVAIQALQLKPGDEVILPSFTIVSCVLQIVRAGLRPVFVDSDPRTWNMDVADVERRIGPRTRAIMAVHIYGLPVDMDPLLALARRHGLLVIEDAAEQIGQTYRGRPVGSLGDVTTLSFYPNKHVTTGEGGMVLADDARIAERSRSLRNLCFEPPRRFVHRELGFNYRMSNLQAAIGVAQLERLDAFLDRKRRMGALYRELLADVAEIELPPDETPYAKNVYWVFGLVLRDEVPFDAVEAMKRLAAKGIGTRPFFAYIHYLDAHWPYDPVPGALADQFGTGDFAVPPPDDPRDLPRWQAEHLDAAAIGALESRYDAEIRGLDSRLGDLFDLLRRRGRWDETILVVTSDHGESFAERGQLQHGLDPYVEQARVPLLVRLPARFGFAPKIGRHTPDQRQAAVSYGVGRKGQDGHTGARLGDGVRVAPREGEYGDCGHISVVCQLAGGPRQRHRVVIGSLFGRRLPAPFDNM